jgi:hypothetical protein
MARLADRARWQASVSRRPLDSRPPTAESRPYRATSARRGSNPHRPRHQAVWQGTRRTAIVGGRLVCGGPRSGERAGGGPPRRRGRRQRSRSAGRRLLVPARARPLPRTETHRGRSCFPGSTGTTGGGATVVAPLHVRHRLVLRIASCHAATLHDSRSRGSVEAEASWAILPPSRRLSPTQAVWAT